ncbi:hypothetical protein KGO95_01420 [Patescibacteria group bacterium]|nr:hypothetical protein [Patescibacteria group bacterium]
MDSVLVFLGIAFLAQLVFAKTRFSNRRNGFLFSAAAVALVFGTALTESYLQYKAWEGDALSRLFLPPYRGFDYFVYYARYHFFDPYLLSCAAGIFFFAVARFLNRRYGCRFFEVIEPYLIFIALFCASTPGWMLYIIGFLLTYLIGSIGATVYEMGIKKAPAPRLPAYYFWLPSAISTILISRWLTSLPLWNALTFYSAK